MAKRRAKPDVRPPPQRETVATRADAERYILAQGAVVNADSLLQDAFYGLFLVALSLERQEAAASGATFRFQKHAASIWGAIQSDAAQRQMAMATIRTVPTVLKLAPAFRRLDWIERTLRLLSPSRNYLAHNPITFRPIRRRPEPEWLPIIGGRGTREAARRRFSMVEGSQLWQDVSYDLGLIAQLVQEINIQIQNLDLVSRDPSFRTNVRISWPRKPKLRSLPHLRALNDRLQEEERQSRPKTQRPPFWE
jgi:hypothetical protein